MKNTYTADFALEVEHVDLNSRWTLSSMLATMQTIADKHAIELGASRADVLARGNAYWVIARLLVEMRRYPVYQDVVSVTTWPGAPDRISFPRYFKFASQSGEALGAATAKYMLLSADDHSIVAPSKLDVYGGLDIFPEVNAQPGKIKLGEPTGEPILRAPSYSDIDLNRHMNNARYAQWVCDLFPTSQYENNMLASFQLNYISDGIERHEIAMQLEQSGDSFAVRGVDTETEKTVFESAGRWAAL